MPWGTRSQSMETDSYIGQGKLLSGFWRWVSSPDHPAQATGCLENIDINHLINRYLDLGFHDDHAVPFVNLYRWNDNNSAQCDIETFRDEFDSYVLSYLALSSAQELIVEYQKAFKLSERFVYGQPMLQAYRLDEFEVLKLVGESTVFPDEFTGDRLHRRWFSDAAFTSLGGNGSLPDIVLADPIHERAWVVRVAPPACATFININTHGQVNPGTFKNLAMWWLPSRNLMDQWGAWMRKDGANAYLSTSVMDWLSGGMVTNPTSYPVKSPMAPRSVHISIGAQVYMGDR